MSETDWRAELKRRLDLHSAKKSAEELSVEQKLERTVRKTLKEPEDTGEAKNSVFNYKLQHVQEGASPKETAPKIKKRPESEIETAPARKPKPKPGPRPLASRRQRVLDLTPVPAPLERILPEPEDLEGPGAGRVSKEILFSRFLAGIVDLALPLTLGFVFVFLASFFLDFDLFMAGSLQWIGILSLVFFYFTSGFFLLTAEQTPGMHLTELHLTDRAGDSDVPPLQVGIRILFFLPSAVSVVGLLWAIFDSQSRCLHDLVSGTQVEPLEEF